MMPGSRKLSKVGEGGGIQNQGIFFILFFFWGGGVGIDGVRTPSTKPWFVHGNYRPTEDFQNERKNALERHIAR